MAAEDDQGRHRFNSSNAFETHGQPSGQPISQSTYIPHQSSGAAEGPSFSKLLSRSIAPLYKSKYFPSNHSEAPLFYSTREGYEIGLNDDEDIIPNENDDRLQSRSHSTGRGLDEEPDESETSRFLSSPQETVIQGALNDGRQLPDSTSQSDPQPSSSEAHTNEDYADAGDDGECPFYVEDELDRYHLQQSISHPVMQLPRHLMASHALSHLMASEIAYGNQQYQSSSSHYAPYSIDRSLHQHGQSYGNTNHHRQSQQVLNPIKYKCVDHKDNDRSPQGQLHFEQVVNREASQHLHIQTPSVSINLNSEPNQHSTNDQSSNQDIRSKYPEDLSRTTLDIPNHPLIRPRPPERSAPLQSHLQENATHRTASYPTSQNMFFPDSYAPTPYIYPSEARDIGSDVLGHPALGPQSYRDSFWMALWLGSLLYAFLQCLWVIFFFTNERASSSPSSPSRNSNLMKSLPVLALLITLTFGFCMISLSLLVMVKRSIKVLVYGSVIGVPSVLTMIGMWTWSESLSDTSLTGMGWISFATFIASSILVKLIWDQRKRIDRTIKVIELSTGVIIEHPSLVLVCLATTLACIVMSLPFVTLVYKLVSLGFYDHNRWVIDSGPITQALLTAFIWSWSLNVIRNLQRIVISGVVSHWYFNRHSPPSPTHKGYSTIESTYNSISRAIGPSLGTVCLSSFLLTCFDSTRQMLKWSNKVTSARQSSPMSQTDSGQGLMNFIFCSNPISRLVVNNILLVIAPIVGFGCRIFEFLSSYTIIYSGITGFSYWESSRRVTSLLSRNGQIGLAHNLMVKLILNLVSLTISLTLGLIGYTVVISRRQGTNDETEYAFEPLIFILCGIMPFWILRFVTDLISNSVDTLFCCWNIDLDIGTNHSNKTEEAFTGRNVARQTV
ncbi:plasma-membrane choline transporter-domain-containing protein [Melampsora americana]|nr:plasma-membrane choline transporter-domain-containing protein [Melampsora americana]